MDRIKPKAKSYCLCEICNEIISPNAPAIETSLGFISDDGFYIDESIIIHADCADSYILQRIIVKLEKN